MRETETRDEKESWSLGGQSGERPSGKSGTGVH